MEGKDKKMESLKYMRLLAPESVMGHIPLNNSLVRRVFFYLVFLSYDKGTVLKIHQKKL